MAVDEDPRKMDWMIRELFIETNKEYETKNSKKEIQAKKNEEL